MYLLFILILLYYLYGYSYAQGAVVYACFNNAGTLESENSWQSVCDEYNELIDAINNYSIFDSIMEFFDVVHTLIKYFIVTYLPKIFYFNILCWLMVFPFIIPVGVKLGKRYQKNYCIRNHQRTNKDHICIYNKFLN